MDAAAVDTHDACTPGMILCFIFLTSETHASSIIFLLPLPFFFGYSLQYQNRTRQIVVPTIFIYIIKQMIVYIYLDFIKTQFGYGNLRS